MKRRAPALFSIASLVVSLLVLPTTPMLNAPAAAQSPAADQPQAAQVALDPPTLRSYSDMLVDQATAGFPSSPGGEIVFRPGTDPAEYAAAKAAAGQAAATGQRAASAAPSRALGPGAINCEGKDQFNSTGENGFSWYPPDADGAVDTFLFGQTTNVHVAFWDMACNLYFDMPLNTFMGYLPPFWPNATQLFDSRIVHDNTFNHWVVASEGFVESTGAQYQWIAVSIDDNPYDGWLTYVFNTKAITGPACFWDYPQLGMSDTAILMTANVFDCADAGQRWLDFNKQWMYQGIGFPFCFWFGGVAELKNWAPPQLTDLENSVWFVRAAPGGSSLNLAQMFSPDAICPALGFLGTLAVPAYSVPPNASQPGTFITLDTLDARFQNRSKQVGGELWNVHSINFGGPAVEFYRIVLGSPPTLAAECVFFTSGSSADFNPSIAVDGAKNIAIGFSSTDALSGVNAQVRLATHTGADCGVFNYLIFASSVPLTGNGSPGSRWGDYSSTSIDAMGNVWGVNERIDNADDPFGGSWGTQFFNATIP